ncbi:MAG: FAD-dependent oxidoreductase [Pseudomonadota bacterium]
MNDQGRKIRIVIVGGGFAGVFAAKALQKEKQKLGFDTEIDLISERNYFVFQPLLPEVAAGTINAQDAVTPLRLLLKQTNIRMGEVTNIDFSSQTIEIAQGSRRIPQFINYDHVILAMGQRTTLERFEGFAEHAFCLRDLAHAHQLRNHVLQCLEHADVTQNKALKHSLLTFVIAGAGFSGVEAAGELHEMLDRALPMYPNINMDDVQTIVVQRGQRILPELSPSLGDYAAERLKARGVKILYGSSLARATRDAVFTDKRERIETHTLICTIGNGPSTLVEKLGLPLTGGRVATNPSLQVAGFENVWAIGDVAHIPMPDQTASPGTAQFAIGEAKQCASNLLGCLRQEPPKPFSFKPRGTMASIGNYQAVADVFGVRVSGLLAWLIWRGFYIGMLPGFPTRLRVALNWAFDYVLPRSIVQVKTTEPRATQVVHYAAGDILFAPAQKVDGFYTIISGSLESRVPAGAGGSAEAPGSGATGETDEADFVRLLGPGDHWGERALSDDNQTIGWLTAVEDCTVLLLGKEDFVQLKAGLPALKSYLDRIPEKIYPPELRAD